MRKVVFFLEKYIGAFLVLLLGATWRIRHDPFDPRTRCIYLLWHRYLLPLAYHRRGEGIVVLVSSSKDGELIAGPIRLLGFITARGSSTRGGARATREILKYSQTRSVAIVPDGPKGPPYVVKEGAAIIARLSGLPIIPVGVHVAKAWVFSSWDRFVVPKPFSRIRVVYGAPIHIDRDSPEDALLALIQQAMEKVGEQSRNT